MRNLKKSFNKNKTSIFSIILAGILSLTFNYSPVMLFAERIKNALAYKSETLQSYYANPTTSTESGISSGYYPSALKQYFSDSDNNFNIKTYYDNRFLDLYAKDVDDYLKSITDDSYGDNLAYFLSDKNYDSFHAYYENETTYLNTTYSCSNFYEFVEKFVSSGIKYTNSIGEEKTIPAIPVLKNINDYNQQRSQYYCSLANFILSENETVQIKDNKYDNVAADASDSDFYRDSVSYDRVKTALDNIIVKTVAIYSYDGVTQNNNVGAIIAKDAPISSKYYYKDSTYISADRPTYSITTITAREKGSDVSVTKNQVYYFGEVSEISSTTLYEKNSNFFKIDEQKTLTSSPLNFRRIESGEFGYIDSTHPTYYKYESIPYQKTNDRYDVYVLDGDVSDDEQATYDSLYYKTITQDDLNADTKGYFVQVPYSTNIEYYFEQLSGLNGDSFKNYCNIFAPEIDTVSGQTIRVSRLYLKFNNNSAFTVYIDETQNNGVDAAEFLKKFPSYRYDVENIKITKENENDYYKVTTSYSNYYKSEYVLYFAKVKVNYSELITSNSETETVYNGEYETRRIASIPYEMNSDVPAKSFETDSNGKTIYALSSESSVQIGTKFYSTVSEETINAETNRNIYVEVSEKVYKSVYGEDGERTFKLYNKHKKQSVKQLYIVVEDKEETEAKESEVYKNLYYKVLTKTEYKNDFAKYLAVEKTDSNYNENFELYYKYSHNAPSESLYVQNDIRKGNAVYIIDDSLTVADKNAYSLNLYTVITTEEYNKNKSFYTQITNNDDNYSTLYTKLYYKYNAQPETERVLYVYSSSSSDKYSTFYNTNANYVASDYELVKPTDKEYVDGVELYFKKIRTEMYRDVEKNTYYYFNTTSTVSLKANSYYMLSFYVHTTGDLAEASFYVEDSNKAIKDLAFENISTNGKWVKYVAFISTDSINSSTVKLSMYMGNKDSILGSHASDTSLTSITGSVLFDDIKITTIGVTDFTKLALDDEIVQDTEEHKNSDDEVTSTIDVVVANKTFANTYDNRFLNLTNSAEWKSMFDFDETSLQSLINGNLDEVTGATTGFTEYTKLWQYYISRDVSVQGKNDKLTQFQDAYMAKDLLASILLESEVDKTPITSNDDEEDENKDDNKDDDKKDDDSDDEKDKGKATTSSTFKDNNYVLKLENKNRLLTLGLVSNAFKIKRAEYYKITVWIYSPDEEATATLSINSVIKTGNKQETGSLLQVSASEVGANVASYSSTSVNDEYGWIPITFYIEGNNLHDQDCNLVLSADKNKTIYFDNICIENISSSVYDTANSDSDKTTYCLSLNPSTSIITNNVTNGYFNNITLTEDYRNPDPTAPRTARTWTVESASSNKTISGIVPTTKAYTDLANNFYDKYNSGYIPYADGFDETNSYSNLYGIYAPAEVKSSIKDADDTLYSARHNYKIYSSSMSLSASSVYDVTFDFYKGTAFTGNMVANIYYNSVSSDKVISSFSIDASELDTYKWNTFHFYIGTGVSSTTIYIEIGVTEATGTVFFKNVAAKTTTKSLDELRDSLISDADNEASESNDSSLFDKDSLSHVKFINFKTTNFSIHSETTNEDSGLYDPKDYTISSLDNKKYTTGEAGVAVANYFTSEVKTTYSVTINKVEYYIGSKTNEETSETTYHLYKYSDLTEEITEIDGKPVTVESFKKVVVGKENSTTDYTSTSKDTTTYFYNFTKDYTLNDISISARELNNKYSQNVMILANSYSTDYTTATAKYTSSFDTSSYYVLKIYVKTSDFADDDIGLNIKVNAISTEFTNVNTTKLDSSLLDENGFACYQILITTNKSSVSNLSVTYSLASEDVTGKGYAIIAGSVLEKYSSEDLFNHYVESLGDNETTVKKFYGSTSDSSDSDNDDSQDADGISWATFFYIFSSLLLVLTLAIAIVSYILKKHPIKLTKKYTNDHERDASTRAIDTTTGTTLDTTTTSSTKKAEKKTEEEIDDSSSKDGII